MANTTVHTLNRAANDRLCAIDRHLEAVGDGTFNLLLKSPFGFTINNVALKLESGTCTAAIKINGTNVTGLSAISVTSSISTTNATALNTVSAGDRITLVISSSSTPTKLGLTLNCTRNGNEGA